MSNLSILSASILFTWAIAAVSPTKVQGEADLPGLTTIETTLVDENATGYGTFQSHNQKIISNKNGIFMTHIRTRNDAYTAQQWRLSRSVDGGQHFSTIYEEIHATNPPVVETDEAGNIYLIRVDFVDGNAYLYRFLATNEYTNPVISTIKNGAAGKYSMCYDREREQLYYFAHNNTFHVIGLDGSVRTSQQLLKPGENAVLQYPLLALDERGALHAAWTTQKHGQYLYWGIHHMLSRDGGQSWERLDGVPVKVPVVADDGGPTDRITLDDEYEVHTWLSNFSVNNGKAHFLYLAQSQPGREHYVRYDVETAEREKDVWPVFNGNRISLYGLDGFFATRSSHPNAPLYCIAADKGRLACLASDDNGQTWYDYAVSSEVFTPYSIGGCREITEDGYIIGSFTNQLSSPQDVSGQSEVYFFRIQAGLAVKTK